MFGECTCLSFLQVSNSELTDEALVVAPCCVFRICAMRISIHLMRAMWRAPLQARRLQARRRRRLSTSALLGSSTPLFRDVLPVESLGENRWARTVAALGVALAFEVLLEEPSAPGWLPALLDEQRVPLSGPMPPIPPRSFSVTEGHGPVPIGVVRLNAMPLLILAGTHRPPNLHPCPTTPSDANLQLADAPIRPAPRRASAHDGR